MTPSTATQQGGKLDVRPFRVTFSDEALADLRRRILATRWPSKETVTDDTQGFMPSADDPQAPEWVAYNYLSWLQEEVVAALQAAL